MHLINTRWFRLSIFRRKLLLDVADGKVTKKWLTGITLYYKPSPTGNPLYLARKEFSWEVS